MADRNAFRRTAKTGNMAGPGEIIAAPLPVLPAAGDDSEPQPPLVAELASRGVTRTTAADLVGQYPADVIEAKLEVFDWLMEKQDKRVAEPGRVSREIHRRRLRPAEGIRVPGRRQARAEAKRQADQEVDEGRRRQREQAASDQARRQAVDAYIKRLNLAERKGALEAEVLARAESEARQGYEEAPARYRASCCWAWCGSTWRGRAFAGGDPRRGLGGGTSEDRKSPRA